MKTTIFSKQSASFTLTEKKDSALIGGTKTQESVFLVTQGDKQSRPASAVRTIPHIYRVNMHRNIMVWLCCKLIETNRDRM